MVSRSLILAYHGCDETLVRKVISGRELLRRSDNKHDWLGNGIYFWEDSYDRAFQWAIEEFKSGKSTIKKPAVVGAVIDLGHCLNLIDSEGLRIVKEAYTGYKAICRVWGDPEAQNKGRNFKARFLDCAVFETLHNIRSAENKPAFDTVRGFFIEGDELYPGAGLRDLDHIQICVRNPKRIVGYFLPRRSSGTA